jgi:hypothetical protein
MLVSLKYNTGVDIFGIRIMYTQNTILFGYNKRSVVRLIPPPIP